MGVKRRHREFIPRMLHIAQACSNSLLFAFFLILFFGGDLRWHQPSLRTAVAFAPPRLNGKLETFRDHLLPHLASYIYSSLGDGQFDFVCLAVMFSKGEKKTRNNPA